MAWVIILGNPVGNFGAVLWENSKYKNCKILIQFGGKIWLITNAWSPWRAAGIIEWWSLSLLQKNSVISSISLSLSPSKFGPRCSKIMAMVDTALHRWVACWWSKSGCNPSTSCTIVRSANAIAEIKLKFVFNYLRLLEYNSYQFEIWRPRRTRVYNIFTPIPFNLVYYIKMFQKVVDLHWLI